VPKPEHRVRVRDVEGPPMALVDPMGILPIRFQPRWKEELVCSSPLGSFILEMPMGVVTVYFPTEAVWPARAPGWAAPHWRGIFSQLQSWCDANQIPLRVEATAQVYGA
jgi:hypothetical protein